MAWLPTTRLDRELSGMSSEPTLKLSEGCATTLNQVG